MNCVYFRKHCEGVGHACIASDQSNKIILGCLSIDSRIVQRIIASLEISPSEAT